MNNEPIAKAYPHHYKLIELMCEVIDVDPDTVDLKEHRWYCNYKWTQDEYQKWLSKAIKYLENNEEAREAIMDEPSSRKEKIKQSLEIKNNGWASNYGWPKSENWRINHHE